MTVYSEEDYLMLSGIQHFCFCRRQWALIHIEHQWSENYFTTDGKLLHKNAHDKSIHEKRGDCLITRGMSVHSSAMGVSGECDVVEFRKNDTEGITLSGQQGLWQPYPVEYKRGKVGAHTIADAMQLCAQGMCLEEMLCCHIPGGALFYCENRRRTEIEFSDNLRKDTVNMFLEMHAMFQKGHTPKVKKSKNCVSCSLKEQCVPNLSKTQSAADYIRRHMMILKSGKAALCF